MFRKIDPQPALTPTLLTRIAIRLAPTPSALAQTTPLTLKRDTPMHSQKISLFHWLAAAASLLLATSASALTLTYTPFEFRTTSYTASMDLKIDSYQAWQDGALSGSGTINKVGAGMILLSATNTYTGTTTITTGALQFLQSASLYNHDVSQWTKLSVLSGAAANFSVGGAGEFTSADIAAVSAAAGVFKAGSTLGLDTSTAPSYLFSLTNNINAPNFEVAKMGLGTLSLSGSNNFAGGFTLGSNYTVDKTPAYVYGGTANSSRVTLASAGALGASGTIRFQGGSLQFSAANTTDYSARFSQAAGQFFNFDTNGQNVTFASALNAAGVSGRLTKTGSGTLTLTAHNTPGTVGIQGGTLQIGTGGELNSSASPKNIEVIDGILQINGGTVNSDIVFVGSDGSLQNQFGGIDRGYLPTGRDASATLSSGLWQVSSLGIGTHNQTGIVTVTGGTLAGGYLYAGGSPIDNHGGTGTLNLSGSGVITASEVNIGYTNSVGVANVSGGRLTSSGNLNVGSNAGYSPSALLTLTSGTISAANVNVGKNTTGTMNVSGGVLTSPGTLLIGGLNITDNGVVNLSGSGTINSSIQVQANAFSGLATLGVSGGVLNAPYLTLDDRMGTTPALLNVSGGVINTSEFSTFGNSVTNISGGTMSVTGTFYFNSESLGKSTLNISGGGFSAQSLHSFQHFQLNVTGGSMFFGSDVYLQVANARISGSGVVALTSGSGNLYLDRSVGEYGTLNFGGATGDAAAAAGTLNAGSVTGYWDSNVVNFNQTGAYTFAPNLLASLSVAKNGAGTTTLTGSNNYTGGTTVNAGTLEIGSNTALGSGLITINGGGVRAGGSERTLANSIVLAGDFTLGRLTNFAGDVTLANNVTMTSANPDVSSPSFSIISGPITGAYGLTFGVGANPIGTIILSGSNSYTGGTTIQGGTLQLGNGGTTGSVTGNITDNGSLVFNRSDALTYGATISGTGNVRQTGTNVLTLSASNSYTGGTTISAGTLGLGNDQAIGTGSVTIIGGGIRAVGTSRTLSNALFTSGTFTLGRSTNFTGTTTLNANTTIIGTNPDGPANAESVFSGPIVGNFGVTIAEGSGTVGLGTGDISFSGNNTYTGGTTLRARLAINGDAALGAASGALTMDGGTLLENTSIGSTRNIILGAGGGTFEVNGFSSFSGRVSGSGGVTETAGFLLLSGSLTYTGATTITNGGALKFGNSGTGFSAPATPSITISSGALYFGDNVTYGGPITGAGQLIHEFAGTTVLTGTGSYTGGTVINGGALQLGNGGSTGMIAGNVNDGGDFRFNRSDALVFSGTISGTGDVSLICTGTTTLTAANPYTGATNVNAGKLIVSGAIAGSVTNLNNGSTLGGAGAVGAINVAASGGTIAPGNLDGSGNSTVGTLNSGNVNLSAGGSGAHLAMQLGGTTANGVVASDRLNVTGTVDITGADLKLDLATGFTQTSSDLFFLITNNGADSITGTFATINGASFDPNNILINGIRYKITYTADFENVNGPLFTGGNDIALMIPEPGTWALLVGGIGMLASLKRLRGCSLI